jgi:hypothetical protein
LPVRAATMARVLLAKSKFRTREKPLFNLFITSYYGECGQELAADRKNRVRAGCIWGIAEQFYSHITRN